jgi:TPR repeat protein
MRERIHSLNNGGIEGKTPYFPVLPVRCALLLLVLVVGCSSPDLSAQSKSPVLRDPAAERSPFYLKEDRSTEELFDAFMLVKKANTGDPVAEHELGLRYLLGKDFPPDTVKAALWIGKAAEQKYLPGLYNYGVLQYNGWGTKWDPFSAFRKFRYTAEHGMTEGEYMYGLLLTDNLIVKRDYSEAYRWIRAAADSGNRFATEVLADFEKTGIMSQIRARTRESANHHSAPSPPSAAGRVRSDWKPVFIDLSSDTLADPDDTMLAREALHFADGHGGAQEESIGDTSAPGPPSPVLPDTVDLPRMVRSAEAGSPEALTFVGRVFDRGIGVRVDRVEAAFYYIRAIRCESRWAPVLLWRLSRNPSLAGDLAERIDRGDLKSSYVWACLVSRGFDRRLTEEQALDHLRRAADGGMTDAMVELAMWYYAGFAVPADNAAGDSLMARAAGLGCREAQIRLAMSSLRGERAAPVDDGLLRTLGGWDADGSVLAGVMLGYCYEGGRGVPADTARAVSFYRKAAQRGSRTAYDALRTLYDDRRPDDPEFNVEEGE